MCMRMGARNFSTVLVPATSFGFFKLILPMALKYFRLLQ